MLNMLQSTAMSKHVEKITFGKALISGCTKSLVFDGIELHLSTGFQTPVMQEIEGHTETEERVRMTQRRREPNASVIVNQSSGSAGLHPE